MSQQRRESALVAGALQKTRGDSDVSRNADFPVGE